MTSLSLFTKKGEFVGICGAVGAGKVNKDYLLIFVKGLKFEEKESSFICI